MVLVIRMFVLVCLVATTLPLHAQSRWIKTFGGLDDDECYSVEPTSDGGFILTGNTRSFGAGQTDIWLIKTNGSGDSLWSKTYGHPGTEEGVCVQPTNDGGYIVGGFTSASLHGGLDIWLLKTDSNGDTLWTRRYGGPNDDYVNAVYQTPEGGYILMGSSNSYGNGNSDFFLVKTNANGDTLWTRALGGQYHDIAFSGIIAADGGYVLAGYTQPSGFTNSDVWLVKTDTSGGILWQKSYGDAANELANEVQQTSDNGFILAGYTASRGAGNLDMWLIKTDSNGDTTWTKTFGGTSSDVANSVQQTSDDGFILTGFHVDNQTGIDLWLIKTDASGNEEWTRSYGGNMGDTGFGVRQTSQGDYIVAGFTESFGAGFKDWWLLRLDASGQTAIGKPLDGTIKSFQLWQNYPNPFNPATNFEFQIAQHGHYRFTIYDALGKEIAVLLDADLLPNHYTLRWEGSDPLGRPVSSGLYLYRLSDNQGNSLSGKALLIR